MRNGRKRGHWMWFIFPQLRGLGSSAMATTFGIVSQHEAAAYLNHPILGPRLLECTRLVNLVEGRSISEILGYPDDLKFRSSMTLFAASHPTIRASRLAIKSSRTHWRNISAANPIPLRPSSLIRLPSEQAHFLHNVHAELIHPHRFSFEGQGHTSREPRRLLAVEPRGCCVVMVVGCGRRAVNTRPPFDDVQVKLPVIAEVADWGQACRAERAGGRR